MKMQRCAWGGAAMVAMVTLALPMAAQGVDRQARAWAASCAVCHGTDGSARAPVAPLAGRDAESLHRTLLEFRNGQRPAATVMHQHAKGYSEDELLRISRYFASLKP